MLSMTTVAAGTAGASGGSQPLFNKVFLYTFVASLLGVVIGTFLIGSATVVNIVIALLVMGACPVLGRALGAGNIGEGIVPAIVGAVANALGLFVLSALTWSLLVGATTKGVALGRLVLFTILGCIVGDVVVLAIASPLGQDPNWLQTAFIVWGVFISAGAAYAMSR